MEQQQEKSKWTMDCPLEEPQFKTCLLESLETLTTAGALYFLNISSAQFVLKASGS